MDKVFQVVKINIQVKNTTNIFIIIQKSLFKKAKKLLDDNILETNTLQQTQQAIKDKKIHKILVCKTNEKLNEHVNRDTNSVKNMIKIVSNYIKTNYKPKTFVLGTKICNDTLCVM